MDLERRLDSLKLECRTKLNPKKKTKDTQNYNPKKNNKSSGAGDFVDSPFYKELSSLNKKNDGQSKSVQSKCSPREKKGEPHPRLSHSMCALTQTNSFQRDNEKDQKKETENLPSKMWWVIPLKTPSTYVPPSFTKSEKSYSRISTLSRPRVIRSAEDLRKQVISQCNELEAARNECIQKLQNKPTTVEECVSVNQINWPSTLELPSSSQAISTVTINTETASATKCSCLNAKEIFNTESEVEIQMKNQFPTDFLTKDNAGSSILVENCKPPKELQHSTLSKSKCSNPLNSERYFTIGDIARKHIVNPITSKLVRLCTKQGELYMDVINDLEKSCQEFENVCKTKILKK